MNLQEHIRKVLREDRKLSNFLKRRLKNLDYEVDSRLNNTFGGSNICIFFKSEEDFFETIMENAIEAMYYNYFSHIDDNSGEWAHEYLDMVDYIRKKHKDKIMKHYDNNCGSGSIPLKENIRKVLKKEYEIPLNVRRRFNILKNILGSSLRSSYPCDYDVLDEFIEDIISDVNQFFRWIDKEDGMTSEQAELTIRDYLLDNIKEYYLEEIQNC
jgi:hypothetical protein